MVVEGADVVAGSRDLFLKDNDGTLHDITYFGCWCFIGSYDHMLQQMLVEEEILVGSEKRPIPFWEWVVFRSDGKPALKYRNVAIKWFRDSRSDNIHQIFDPPVKKVYLIENGPELIGEFVRPHQGLYYYV